MPVGDKEIEHRFGYHPATDETAKMHEQAREAFKAFAMFLDKLLPDGRSKSSAFRNLQQSSMWANYAIAELAPLATTKSSPIIRLVPKPGPPATSQG